MKVLILGCGYTGQHLAHWLLAQGIGVHLTNRQGHQIPGLDAPTYAFAQLTTAGTMSLPLEALVGVTHVLSTIPPNQQGDDPVLVALLDQLQTLGLVWYGYLSTTGVYGDTQGAWVDETSPANPLTERSHHRAKIESILLRSPLPTHIFRLPGIYGPGRSIFDRLRNGTARNVDKPGHVFSRIHVEDIVQTLWCSMQHPQPRSIYNVADDEPSEPSQLIVEAAKLLGIAPPPLVPFAQIEMSPMAASFWRECRRVANHKIKTELGVQLHYPSYREGLRGILAAENAEHT